MPALSSTYAGNDHIKRWRRPGLQITGAEQIVFEPLRDDNRNSWKKIRIDNGHWPRLGLMIAREAARHGANVAMVSRSTALMEEVAAEATTIDRETVVPRGDINGGDYVPL